MTTAAKQARAERARRRRDLLVGEVAPLGTPKPLPYATSSPEERLAAATRLIFYHMQIRGDARVPRAEWPGETFKCGPGTHKDLADVEELERE